MQQNAEQTRSADLSMQSKKVSITWDFHDSEHNKALWLLIAEQSGPLDTRLVMPPWTLYSYRPGGLGRVARCQRSHLNAQNRSSVLLDIPLGRTVLTLHTPPMPLGPRQLGKGIVRGGHVCMCIAYGKQRRFRLRTSWYISCGNSSVLVVRATSPVSVLLQQQKK